MAISSITLLIQVLLYSHVLTMEPEIDWSMKIALISESSLDTHIPADITFKLKEDGVEHKVGAHKIIMGMASPVFNKLLIKMGTLDNRTKELFVKGTTYGAFNIMKNAIYGMVPMGSSLKGKSVQEVFSIYDLVTRYQILELRQVVQNHLASFPLTDDTVLEVAADAKDHLLTFEEEARSLLVRCAKYLKPKFKTVQSVLEYFAENTANKEILHELLVLTKDNQDNNLALASTVVAIDCRKEPCHNEVGVEQNRGQVGHRNGQGFRSGLVYGEGRNGGVYNRGRDGGGYRESLDNLGDYRGRDRSGYGESGEYNRGRDRDGNGYRESGAYNKGRGGSGYRESGEYTRGIGGSGYSRGRDYDEYDDSEYGGGGYGSVGDNRDYGGDGRNDGGYRNGGGYGRERDSSEHGGGNGYRGSQDERGYTRGEYGRRYRGKGDFNEDSDGDIYREENVYGGGRHNGKKYGGTDDRYGGDIGAKVVRGEYGGDRYHGGYRDSGDRNGGGFKGGRGRDY